MTTDSQPTVLTGRFRCHPQTVREAVTNIRASMWPRIGFSGLTALLSLNVMPIWLAASWFAAVAAWELWLRQLLEDKVVLPAATHSEDNGFGWLAAFHLFGSSVYTIFPATIWATGAPAAMVLATAWICGSANHLFVYYSADRRLLIACGLPVAAMAIGAPLLAEGFTLDAAIGVSALAALVFAAGWFGFDRHLLLANLAKAATARAAAEQANTAKSQFLATMSHELRSPLNAVIGYAELIEEETGEGPIAEDATKIRISARQLLGVIDTILDISKLETGSIVLRRERGPVSAVLQELRAATLPLASISTNKIIVVEADALGDADIDHMRLHQCLMQLVSNAAKFTHDGEIRIEARRETVGAENRLVFNVTDTGPGITAEDKSRIFEPFVQGERADKRGAEGAGLGLTLVRRLARLMSGDVTCESTPGKGSTFTLWVDAGLSAS